MTDFSKLSDTTAGDAVNACKAETDRLRSELEAVKRKLSSIRDMIPMDYLMRHDASGATGPTERLDLVAAVRDYSDARWRIIDRLKKAESGLEAAKREALELELRAYLHPNGAIWSIDNCPAGIDFTCNGWVPLYARAIVEKHGRDG